MDGIRGAGNLNPMSSNFMTKALKTAQTQAATVKDKKDMTPKDETKDVNEDMVTLSKHGEKSVKDKTDSAHQSGVMSELTKREKKDELEENTMFGGKDGKVSGYGYTEETDRGEGASKQAKTDELDLAEKLEVLSIMNRDPEEIKGNVPEAYFKAAQKIVEGQIQKGKPAESLSGLKPVETAPLELKPMNYVDIMPIHDSNNKPIPMDMGAGMGGK